MQPLADTDVSVYALGMAEYTRRQFTRVGDFGVSEEWRTGNYPSSMLAYVDHYNGAISTAQVFDPATGWNRTYPMRDKDRAMAIVERHLERNGYKKCIEFHTLTGETLRG